MREVANSFAELAAIIMILITIAVTTAALAQWGATVEIQGGAGEAQSVSAASPDSR